MPITMQKMIEVSGLSRDAINKIVARHLVTKIPEGKHGLTRVFTRDNAFEILCFAALEGTKGSEAAQVVRHWRLMRAESKLPNFWLFGAREPLVRGNGKPNGVGFNNPNMAVQALFGSGDLVSGSSHDRFIAARVIALGKIKALIKTLDQDD
ncbi:MAG: hypothetical protein D6773_12680 [Alphaproteobacteria bacterium]|nr:MAG: hypothetical protein D6773_12680 [Alphaproteobacteria bacterium]